MTRLFFAILGLAMVTVAVAEHHESAAMHVKIDAIIEAGEVHAVEGITSSGQPNVAALEVLRDSDYAAVIDLRGEEEKRGIDEATEVEALGMAYVHFPVVGNDAINAENAARLDELLSNYDKPVLVHCGSGNRVGALLALRKSMQGADDEAAIEYGKAAGLTRLEKVVRERLEAR
jgi:uncharacterized protein (TIGR01244 family)